MTKQILPDTREIRFAYDANGNVTSVTPPIRPAHGFDYTPADQLYVYTPPDAGFTPRTTTYAYNADQQLTSITRPDGQQVVYSYESNGRLDFVTLPTGTIDVGYDAEGRLGSVSAPSGAASTFGYDGPLPTSITTTGPVPGTIAFGYDADLRPASLTVDSEAPIAFGYDADGLLTSAGGLALARNATTGFLETTTLGTTADSRTYTSYGELDTWDGTIGGSSAYSFDLDRDDAGRITTRSETLEGTAHVLDLHLRPGPRLADRGQTRRQPRRVLRLRRQRQPHLVERLLGLGHSHLRRPGPVAHRRGGGLHLHPQRRAPDQDPRLRRHDLHLRRPGSPAGGDPPHRSPDRLPGGRLGAAHRQEGGRDAGRGVPLRRGDLAGGRNRRPGQRHVPVRLRHEGERAGLHRRGWGPRTESSPTTSGASGWSWTRSQGQSLQQIDYDAFGRITFDSNPGAQPFGFAGGLYDPQTGLVRFGARDYDPEVGRWAAKDPVGFGGGSTGLFTHAENDPENTVDPTGRIWNWASAEKVRTTLARIFTAVGGEIEAGPGFDTGEHGTIHFEARSSVISKVRSGSSIVSREKFKLAAQLGIGVERTQVTTIYSHEQYVGGLRGIVTARDGRTREPAEWRVLAGPLSVNLFGVVGEPWDLRYGHGIGLVFGYAEFSIDVKKFFGYTEPPSVDPMGQDIVEYLERN